MAAPLLLAAAPTVAAACTPTVAAAAQAAAVASAKPVSVAAAPSLLPTCGVAVNGTTAAAGGCAPTTEPALGIALQGAAVAVPGVIAPGDDLVTGGSFDGGGRGAVSGGGDGGTAVVGRAGAGCSMVGGTTTVAAAVGAGDASPTTVGGFLVVLSLPFEGAAQAMPTAGDVAAGMVATGEVVAGVVAASMVAVGAVATGALVTGAVAAGRALVEGAGPAGTCCACAVLAGALTTVDAAAEASTVALEPAGMTTTGSASLVLGVGVGVGVAVGVGVGVSPRTLASAPAAFKDFLLVGEAKRGTGTASFASEDAALAFKEAAVAAGASLVSPAAPGPLAIGGVAGGGFGGVAKLTVGSGVAALVLALVCTPAWHACVSSVIRFLGPLGGAVVAKGVPAGLPHAPAVLAAALAAAALAA